MARSSGDSKARILAAAESQLRERGAASLTIDAVAREARCAKGLVTYHFSSKARLLAAAVDQMLAGREDRWEAALSGSTPDAAIKKSWALLDSEAGDGVWRAWSSLLSGGDKLTVQTVNNATERFTRTVTRAIGTLLDDQGLGLRASVNEVGRLVAASVHGLSLHLASGGHAEELEGAYYALWVGVLALTEPAR